MIRLVFTLIFALSLTACSESVQNSEKQKEMTQGSSATNSTTATDQHNYGAGATVGSNNAQQPAGQHTDNMTNPKPTTPTPQADSGQGGQTGPKESGARNRPPK